MFHSICVQIKPPGFIPDIKIPVTYKETFIFEEVKQTKYTTLMALRELQNSTQGYGSSNTGLYYICIILIYYFTLARIALFFVVWALPLPKACHRWL